MRNSLLEINFLKNIIEKCNKRILQLNEEIKNGKYNETNSEHIILKQQINSFIIKKEKAMNTFKSLIK